MFAHFLGFLILLGSALLVVLGLGVTVFALARRNGRLARRAAALTFGYAALYLWSPAPSRCSHRGACCPVGGEVSFCGLDCHLHVSVLGSETDGDRVGVIVRVRSDARQEPEYPRYLQFRLLGADGVLRTPENEARAFLRPLEAGQSYVDSLYFPVSLDGVSLHPPRHLSRPHRCTALRARHQLGHGKDDARARGDRSRERARSRRALALLRPRSRSASRARCCAPGSRRGSTLTLWESPPSPRRRRPDAGAARSPPLRMRGGWPVRPGGRLSLPGLAGFAHAVRAATCWRSSASSSWHPPPPRCGRWIASAPPT